MQADYKKARSDTPPMPGIEAGGSVLLQRGAAGHACPLGLHFWMAALELGLLLTRTQSDLTKLTAAQSPDMAPAPEGKSEGAADERARQRAP